MTEALDSLYFADPRAFVIGVEHLGDAGIEASFATRLKQERDVDPTWIASFDAAYSTYRRRARELYEKNPQSWFPPRKQNICVVVDAARTRPFYVPFNNASWLVYATDFDPEASNVELGCYLLMHTERLGLAQNPAAAVAHNLGYWLLRSDEEIAAFRDAAERCQRPDASAFVALAESMDWIVDLRHPQLRPLEGQPTEPVGQLPQSGLIAKASMQSKLVELVGAFRSSVVDVGQRYFAAFEGPSGGEALGQWIADARPNVLVTGRDGHIVWDPAAPEDTTDLVSALADASEEVVASLRADLEVASERTQRFLSALRDPEALPRPGDDIEQSGLTYIHATRKLIAYNLHEPQMNRLAEPAAPYERLMLGARTVHEWGHLAVDAGLVRVPEDRQSDNASAALAFAEALQRIVDAAPSELDAVAAEELALTGADTLGVGLRDIVLGRMPDYAANVLARELLSVEEMETYVRQQVTTLVQASSLGPFGQLARYAYEYQYLRLSAVDDPMRYFIDSTWFMEMFVETGVTTLAGFEALVTAMAAICDGYVIDETAISV